MQRLTVYRLFPDDAALIDACSSHWRDRHPLPDPASWTGIAAVGHALRFSTWRSLTDEGLADGEAANMMAALVERIATERDG